MITYRPSYIIANTLGHYGGCFNERQPRASSASPTMGTTPK